MIHPPHDMLEALADNNLADSEMSAKIRAHCVECEFCREYVEEYTAHRDAIKDLMAAPPSPAVVNFLASLEQPERRGLIIDLLSLPTEAGQQKGYLAADSPVDPHPEMLSIATLYSENPEIVLKMMRNQSDGSRYLQVIAESDELTANVLVCAPAIGAQIATDTHGRAPLPHELSANPGNLLWQVRLPEVTFDLKPLIFNPEKIEYSNATVLETDRGDRIRITFVGKTVGKQIEVELLALDGKTDFAQAKILLVEDRHIELKSIESGARVLFTLPEQAATVNLRIFP